MDTANYYGGSSDPNPYGLPDLPAPGQTVAVPNQVILNMDCRDNTQQQLEELVEAGMRPDYERNEGYANLRNEILGADSEENQFSL